VTQATALLFARCVGFIVRAPGFSHRSVPVMARAAFAFVLALAFAPAFANGRSTAAGSFIVALITELLLGAAIGFAASALYDGAMAGGKMLDDYVGIQVSQPAVQAGSGEGFTQLWGFGFLAVYFLLGGYQVVVAAFAMSLRIVPLGHVLMLPHLADYAIGIPTLVMRAAALVAGPAIVLGFLANLALGAISRVIPRFNNFTLTFPVVFTVILLATLATLTNVLPQAARPWIYLPMLRP